MTSAFYLQFTMHGLCDWVAAFAIAYWIAQVWSLSPEPVVVRVMRSPTRAWLMVIFGCRMYG